ncbi:MAG: hypothetical protein J0I09_03885 [Sphingobacteriia bacterium]|nr:hypothetical protein [Sphingobacteriia bacterium]
MATIKIQRTSEYNNRARNYKIFIDGQQAGTIANGETINLDTTAGQHTVTAKIDWCSSPDIPVHVNDNQTKTLRVGGLKNGQWLMPTGLAVIVLNFILSTFTDINYVIYLIIPLFLILIYYLTIGRKKYLTLTELNDN